MECWNGGKDEIAFFACPPEPFLGRRRGGFRAILRKLRTKSEILPRLGLARISDSNRRDLTRLTSDFRLAEIVGRNAIPTNEERGKKNARRHHGGLEHQGRTGRRPVLQII